MSAMDLRPGQPADADPGGVAGIDLHLPLAGRRTVRDIEAALRALVSRGALVAGTRLPASRTLATDLGIARNTVGEVYARLAAEGWLETRVGAGTWVAVVPRPEAVSPAGADTRAPFELRGGLVDAGDFPTTAWASSARRVLRELPSAAFGYPPPAGVTALRESLAAYLARTRGVRVDRAGVFVGSGFGDLLSLVCRVLRGQGARRVAVEEYGHDRHRRIIAAAGLDVVPVPVDGEGVDVARLAATGADAVLLTPAHQFPTGVPLSSRRRRAVIEWAERDGGLVLEDDYDGEFRYDRRRVGALQPSAPDRVVYLGTSSKALAPAVGVAWAVTPRRVHEDLIAAREVTGGSPGGLHQHVLAGFIDSFAYDRAVRRRRAAFRARRDLLEELLSARVPEARIEGLAAGLQCLVRTPDIATEERAVAGARQRGVAVHGLSAYRATHPSGRGEPDTDVAGVVVGYGASAATRAEAALRLLVDAIASATAGRRGTLDQEIGARMSMPGEPRGS